jgi:hypothetical protein
MRHGAFIAGSAIILMMCGSAQARCVDGTLGGVCTRNGKSGHEECLGGAPICIPDPPPATRGRFIPKYQIIAVNYAPPGSAAGGRPSSVIYGSSSTMGTTTAVGNSFKQSYNVSFTSTASILILAAGSGLSFTFSNASGSTSTIDLKKTTSVTQTFSGPNLDGVNHDFDQIWLWLQPHLLAAIDQNNINLTIDAPTSSVAQFLYVSQLKNPALISQQLMSELNSFGITTADFPQILAEDPFAFGDTTAPDPSRFSKLDIDYPLDPVLPNANATSYNYTVSNAMTNSVQTTSQSDYNVGVTLSATVLGQSLKSQDSWDWTVTSNSTISAATVDSTGFTLGQPSGSYTGPDDLQVYFDNRYRTYYFRPVALTAPSFRGVLVESSGAPISGEIVSVTAQGKTFYAATNSKGDAIFRRKDAGRAAAPVLNSHSDGATKKARHSFHQMTRSSFMRCRSSGWPTIR